MSSLLIISCYTAVFSSEMMRPEVKGIKTLVLGTALQLPACDRLIRIQKKTNRQDTTKPSVGVSRASAKRTRHCA